ncbi:MAG: glycoside hydrolase family 97 N-terminal domain-containing protein, partial [Bacteroidaceae bacterium]|nr:glycoside hydrolase family 97 N-terminal domain-containing protein [Bacteroidaceae bacterium]
MMKKRYVALCLAMASILGGKAEVVVSSPDGRISVDFQMSDGSPMYSVIYDGQVAILPSPLGLKTTMGDYTRELSWQKERTATGEYTGTYALPSIKVGGEHSYRYNQVTLPLLQKERPAMQIEFRVSNTDVAFRYILHTKRDTRSCVITSEASTFRVSEHALTYMTPQSYPMGGFARTTPSYETKYTLGEPVGRNGWGNGYTFPCLFEVPNDDDTHKMWILVSETGTDGGYVGCRLMGGNGGEYRIGFPMEGEMNGWGTSTVQMALPGST